MLSALGERGATPAVHCVEQAISDLLSDRFYLTVLGKATVSGTFWSVIAKRWKHEDRNELCK
jgi:hypothetical protein